MKFDLIKPLVEHVDLINAKTCYGEGERDAIPALIELSYTSNDSQCVSLTIGKKVVGIVGCALQWKGTGVAWAWLDAECDKYPLSLVKITVKLLEYTAREQGLHRISIAVRSNFKAGNRFASQVGFSLEGRMYGYFTDGEDANLYARLF